MPLPLILKKCDGFYSIPLFEKFNVRAIFTTRKYNMSFPLKKNAQSSLIRKKVYKKIGLDYSNIVCPSQIHGELIGIVDERHRGKGVYYRSSAIQETDALITDKRKLPISILTADCLPVFIFDYRLKVIAIVHAGWKGVHSRIISKTVQKMHKEFQTQPCDLLVVLGPAIRADCYEVGEEFLDYFPKSVFARGRKLYFDIIGAAVSQIKEEGVKEERIFDSRLCTSCMKDEFFSYRREGALAGRSMSIIELL